MPPVVARAPCNEALWSYHGGRLRLLPEDRLVKTGPVDFARWNYHGVLGYIQRRRFLLVLDALRDARVPRLLEMGYGSGVFQPALARHCQELYGVDVHDKAAEVAEMLASVGVASRLTRSAGEPLPYPSGYFDRVVAISALEFIDDLDGAFREVRRVLSPEGRFIVVTPGKSPILDLGLKLLTGRSADQDFGDRRERETALLARYFETIQTRTYPRVTAPGICLYTLRQLRGRV